jgi:hypothetical protein
MSYYFQRVLTIILILFIVTPVVCQNTNNIGVGQWRDHLPFNNGNSIAQSTNFVYCATQNGVIILSKEDNSIERLSRANGLSDINLACLSFDEPSNTLMIGYKNGNLDLVQNNQVINIGDIKRSTVVQGGKTINAIRFFGDRAYICCNFGIVVYDLSKKEIKTTLYPSILNPDIRDVASDGTRIFAATSKGLFTANLSDPALPYYVAWTQDTLLKEKTLGHLTWFDEGIYVSNIIDNGINQDTIFNVKNGQLSILRSGEAYYGISSNANKMVITINFGVAIVNADSLQMELIYPSPAPRDAIVDQLYSNIIWVADKDKGLARNQDYSQNIIFKVPGPSSPNAFRIKSSNGTTWVAPGAWDVAYSPLYLIDGVFKFDGVDWSTFPLPTATDYLRDVVSLCIDPADVNHIYAASWGNGVGEINNGVLVQQFGADNSAIVGIDNYPNDIRVSDLALDSDGNLWVSSSSSAKPLAVKTPSGEWSNFSFNSIVNSQFLGNMLIDNAGLKWMIVQDRGLLVVKTDGTSLSGYKVLNDQIGNGALPSNSVLSLAQDLDGQIWVGTSKGICVFYTPEAIFENGANNWDAQTIIIGQDGFNQYLLKEEEVTAIAVDGANRKWIGTRKAGIFVVSEDGTQQIAQYTFENSPLLSNTISSLTIDGVSGELFIGTDVGICSFRTDATTGTETFGHVYAFPNPVEHDYTGTIAISGLVRDADVKITDVSGNIVYSTVAKGGTAVWNGNLFSGQRAATGVYLVFSTNADGSQTQVTKILFIN